MRVSVIIPALNEAESIGFVVHEMPWHLIDECIVVDNGCTDATAANAIAAGARVITAPRGYGAACMAGAEAALPTSDTLVFMDGDGSDVTAQMPDLLAPIVLGTHDFVMGSRLSTCRRQPGSMLLSQVVAGKLVGTLLHLLYGAHFSDMGPFRVIRRSALVSLNMRERTYGWSLEMQAKAARAHLRIKEVPVDYRVRYGGESKVSGDLRASFRAATRILYVLFRIATGRQQ